MTLINFTWLGYKENKPREMFFLSYIKLYKFWFSISETNKSFMKIDSDIISKNSSTPKLVTLNHRLLKQAENNGVIVHLCF